VLLKKKEKKDKKDKMNKLVRKNVERYIIVIDKLGKRNYD